MSSSCFNKLNPSSPAQDEETATLWLNLHCCCPHCPQFSHGKKKQSEGCATATSKAICILVSTQHVQCLTWVKPVKRARVAVLFRRQLSLQAERGASSATAKTTKNCTEPQAQKSDKRVIVTAVVGRHNIRHRECHE